MAAKASPTAVSANSGAEEAGLSDPGDSQLLGESATDLFKDEGQGRPC